MQGIRHGHVVTYVQGEYRCDTFGKFIHKFYLKRKSHTYFNAHGSSYH